MKKCITLLIFLLWVVAPLSGYAEDSGTISGSSLFGSGDSYIHPYGTLTELYDDNVYRTEQGKIGDYATVFAPGVWFAMPGTQENKLNLSTYTLTPGGVGIVEDRGETYREFQGFLNYGATVTRYDKTDDNDTTDQQLSGLFSYSPASSLRFQVQDQYLHGHDERGQGAFGQLNAYISNLIGGSVTYLPDSKFRIRGEYSVFNVGYDEETNKFVNRTDTQYAGYVFYNLSGNSSVFVEYDIVESNYDYLNIANTKEYSGWSGFRYRLSEKTMGEIKAGYLSTDYAETDMKNAGNYVVQAWLDYELTHKSRIQMIAARMFDAPDAYELTALSQSNLNISSNSGGAIDNQLKVDFIHDLSSKITATVDGEYRKISYIGDYVYNGITADRNDDKYTGVLALNYQIWPHVGVKTSYTYIDQRSTFPGLSYTDNTVMLTLGLSL